MTLGYIPDRAYYFVVSRTLELGILGWSPVNLCPPENGKDMPCPVPAGGVVPWQPTPAEAALPKPRTGGNAAQLGKHLLYIGGSDGSAPSATTFVTTVDKANFGAWSEGPALPEARTNAGLATLSGAAYLVGGAGPAGAPTKTVWSIGLNPDTSELTTWSATFGADKAALPTLPQARSGAAVVAVADGIVVVGGLGPDGKPTSTVWKSTINSAGVLGAFKDQPALPSAVTDATAAIEGTFLWVYGGSDANGPTTTVLRADYGSSSTATGSAAPGVPSGAPSALPPAVTPAASGSAAPGPTVIGTTPPTSPAASETTGPAATTAASQAPAATTAPTQAPSGTQAPAGSSAPAGSAAPAASGAPEGVVKWTVVSAAKLPGPRTNAAGFAANGALYVAGGSDGTSPKRELYWAVPDATGNLPGGWRHLDLTDLPAALTDAAPVVTGGSVVLIGGTSQGGPVATSVKASLAPQEPFFRLGLVGVVVPALQIGGEIGQQLGYLAAAGVGTGNFVLLVIVGWALNHRPQLKEWWERRRLAREARAPEAES
jgi:hypothetical protein